jgi:hypothetical protein
MQIKKLPPISLEIFSRFDVAPISIHKIYYKKNGECFPSLNRGVFYELDCPWFICELFWFQFSLIALIFGLCILISF